MSFWKSLLHLHFPSMEDHVQPSPTALPPKIELSPEPSCFAKGIAQSIKLYPEEWETVRYVSPGITDLYIRHIKTDQSILATYVSNHPHSYDHLHHPLDGCGVFSSLTCCPGSNSHTDSQSRSDASLIARTIEANPIGQLKESKEAAIQAQSRHKICHNYFTILGCPEPLPPLPPSEPVF